MTSLQNTDLQLTLDECVAEVLGILTGLDLQYNPEEDRYNAITRQLNRSVRAVALEREWSWYASTISVGTTVVDEKYALLDRNVRPRIIGDDSVRLVRPEDGHVVKWAYFLPRDALHKYADRNGLWASVTRNTLQFSRGFYEGEAGLDIQVPVMREPVPFRLPQQPEDPNLPPVAVPSLIRNQLLDFPYPDLVIARAAMFYAGSDPVMQPRVQTLDAAQKDLMYQIIEREERASDTPYMNEFTVPIQSGIEDYSNWPNGHHPHSDERR